MTQAQSTSRKQICNTIYFVLLCVLAMAMPTSNFVMNIGWVFLLLNWLIEADFSHKFQNFRTNYLLHAFLVLVLFYVVSMFWSSDWHYGLNDLRQKLPLLVVPLVILTSEPLSQRRWAWLQVLYVATVFVTSIIGLVRYLSIPNLPYREIIPFISHIRFSLNVCLSIGIIIAAFSKHHSWITRIIFSILALWFLAFLLLLQSYTGCVVMVVMAVVVAIASRKRLWIIATFLVLLTLGGISGYYIYDYYHLTPLASQPLKATTANGNPYTHGTDGFIERGNYITQYVCNEELKSSWAERSDYPIDSITATGYPLRGALVRYLNCMGLTKDSVGVSQLQTADIEAIELGIANPTYLRQGSARKFFDVILFEFETMRHQSSIRDFTMLERFELWRNGWQTFLKHPIFGVGTGDVVNVAHDHLAEINSPIRDTDKTIHNQYITLLLTFGIVGTLIILLFFIKAWHRGRPLPLITVAYLTIVLVSFINEDTLETLAGIIFVVFWTSILSIQKKCINITH